MWVGEHSRQSDKLVDLGMTLTPLTQACMTFIFIPRPHSTGLLPPPAKEVTAKLQGGVPCPDVGGESASDAEPVLNPSGPRGSRTVLGHLRVLSPCALAAPCPVASFLGVGKEGETPGKGGRRRGSGRLR